MPTLETPSGAQVTYRGKFPFVAVVQYGDRQAYVARRATSFLALRQWVARHSHQQDAWFFDTRNGRVRRMERDGTWVTVGYAQVRLEARLKHYFGEEAGAITIAQAFTPATGWAGDGRPATVTYLRQLKRDGAVTVALKAGARTADFAINELLGVKS